MTTTAPAPSRRTPASRFPAAGFRRGMETADMDLALESWTEDCVLRSLAPNRLPVKGKPAVHQVVEAVTTTCEGFAYTGELRTDDVVVLPFRCSVSGMDMRGIDFLRLNEDAKCEEMSVMGRPYLPINVLVGRSAIKLARRGGFLRGALATLLIRTLEAVQRGLHPLLMRRIAAAMDRSLARGGN